MRFRHIGLMLGFFAISACATAPGPRETADREPARAVLAGPVDSDSGALGLESISFKYKSADLNAEATAALVRNAKILRDTPGILLQVEGHCDQKGGDLYNLRLGERRAKAVRALLAKHGVNPNRLSVISYGRGKPMDTGGDEAAQARNRRVNLVVVSQWMG